jgi:hypothetical protein
MQAALEGLVAARQFSAGWVSLCIAAAILSTPAIAVNDAYLPYVESLQSVQARSYAQSAPRGQDEPVLDPAEPLAIPVRIIERQ